MEQTPQPDLTEPAGAQRRVRLWPRRWPARALLVCALLLLVSGSATWLGREQIAGNLIDSYLARQGVAARYTLVAITPTQQVIADLAVGDPAAPDLTADRVVVDIGLGLLGPAVERITLERPRLFGSYRGGTVSFGSLDPLIFTDSSEPARLPAITLALRDARARIDSDFGAIGIKLEGEGRLDDGFAGTLAMTAPGLGREDCRAREASVFGALVTRQGTAELTGPLRLRDARCGGARLARADIGSRITLGKELDDLRGEFALAGKALSTDDAVAAMLGGTARAGLSAKGVVIDHDLALQDISAGGVTIARATIAGGWRALAGSDRSQWRGKLSASGLALGPGLTRALAEAQQGAAGTLAEPLLAQFASSLSRALDGASFSSEASLRLAGREIHLVVPEARLRSRAGAVIAALSQVNWSLGADSKGALRGNFVTGGQGLPRINGRIAQSDDGNFALRLAMADYRADDSRIALPRLSVDSGGGDGYRFSGLISASGAVPGGRISGLEVPLEGRWSGQGGLLLGTRCADLRLAGLQVAGLELAARSLTVCPAPRSAAMLRYAEGLRLDAATSRLDLSGQMGGAPARVAAARAVLRYPGTLGIEGVDVRLGESGAETRLRLASLTGTMGSSLQGEFAGGAAGLAAVPLDLDDMAGRWRFADGVLTISEARFQVSDRTDGQARFEPLAGKGGALVLEGDAITASAALHHPASGQKVAGLSLVHNLGTAAGRADIRVDDLVFGPGLDAEDLSYLAKGVVAGVRGTINGHGRIDWSESNVTSSGRFATPGLDFAAAFGPVRGLAGEIVFTDLLGLTTAPDQRLAIAAIDTGVEVLDGRIRFALKQGTLIELADARWPFMGGQLVLRPVTLDFGRPSEKRYVFEMTGLDAAVFIAEMELTNLGASGIFDGVVPIVFDASGNGRIENGLLTARAPGGNVAYVGDLTYEDMGAVANYAFRALRSLDYREMSVVLDGSLTGEIISKFQFDGVRQGEGTSRNFITRRLARLPILFRVNVKAESFYELSTVVRSFFDVTYLGNPVDRGLLKAQDGRLVPTRQPALPQSPLLSSDNSVQPPESEDRP
ncbi:MAG: YdbH domain-containing protein [Erythrobacter sp.]